MERFFVNDTIRYDTIRAHLDQRSLLLRIVVKYREASALDDQRREFVPLFLALRPRLSACVHPSSEISRSRPRRYVKPLPGAINMNRGTIRGDTGG